MMKNFSEWLSWVIKLHQLTLIETAAIFEVSDIIVRDWMEGKSIPNNYQLKMIEQAFGSAPSVKVFTNNNENDMAQITTRDDLYEKINNLLKEKEKIIRGINSVSTSLKVEIVAELERFDPEVAKLIK